MSELDKLDELKAQLASVDKAAAIAQPVAWLRAATTTPEYGGYEVCKANDPNGFPVITAPQPQAAQSKDAAESLCAAVINNDGDADAVSVELEAALAQAAERNK